MPPGLNHQRKGLSPMSNSPFDLRLIFRLVVISMIVGAVLYWLRISPGDIYGWVANQLASLWNWFAGTGLDYLLLGASIVVPIYLILRLKQRVSR